MAKTRQQRKLRQTALDFSVGPLSEALFQRYTAAPARYESLLSKVADLQAYLFDRCWGELSHDPDFLKLDATGRVNVASAYLVRQGLLYGLLLADYREGRMG